MSAGVATDKVNHVEGQRFVWSGLGWHGYQTLLELVGERAIRLTYDRGNVELMSPHSIHERRRYLLGRIIDAITEELDIPVLAVASTTLQREDRDRGLEPDQCYYFQNAAAVRNPARIALDVDPPPDLAIEIDISRSSLDRLGIYAALAIPELWRYDGENLSVLLLQPDGRYTQSATSAALPFLPLEEVARFLRDDDHKNDTRWAREVRTWVRDRLTPRFRAG